MDLVFTLLTDNPESLTNILLAIGFASIADAVLPVPAPTSPWYRARRLLSVLAANVWKARAFAPGQPTAVGVAAAVGSLAQSIDGTGPHAAIRDVLDRLDPADPAAYAAGLAQIAGLASGAARPG